MAGLFHRAHPGHAELFEHTEARLAGQVAISCPVARHVASCARCRAAVDDIQATLSIAGDAGDVEPRFDIHASIMMATKAERALENRLARRAGRMLKPLATAVCLILAVLSLILTAPIKQAGEPTVAQAGVASSTQLQTAGFGLESLRQLTREEQLLGSALDGSSWSPTTRWERVQHRALTELDEDIEEALDALQQNAALVRATAVVSANRELKKETLKALYVNRNL